MKARILIAVALLSVFLYPHAVLSQSTLKGVWKGMEAHYQGPDTAFIWKDIQPCLYMFTERYYSIVYVEGTKPRALLPEGTTKNNITNEQLRAVITPFVANSGSYEVNDTAVVIQPMVALLPNGMQGGKRSTNFKVEKDVLWLFYKNNSGGTLKLKFSRLE